MAKSRREESSERSEALERVVSERAEQLKRTHEKPKGTYEERLRAARDNTARQIKDHAERQGKDISYEQALKTASDIANQISREDSK